MALSNLRQLTPIFKEALDQTFVVTKFFCCLHIANKYLCTFALAQGPSMLPTLNLTGSLVLAERLSTRFERVGKDDVVLIRSPEDPRRVIVKRIAAVEGDAVMHISNNSANHEAALTLCVVPRGHVWVEGDNKHNSRDSRHFGAVPYGLLEGRVFCVVWPRDDIGFLGGRVQ